MSMTEQSEDTAPVYIEKPLKKEVQKDAADLEKTMKDLMQRLTIHGRTLGLQQIPEGATINLTFEDIVEHVDLPEGFTIENGDIVVAEDED